MWWPAIGCVFVGIGGMIEPRILGVGYDTIHKLLRGEIIGAALIGILVGKSLIWSIALGSGTSGGVLAPLLMMGGALGAAEAGILPVGDTSLWALISMAAMMGGTMRSPLTAIIFAVELTHDFNLLPGLLVACFAAHGTTVLLLRRSILTEKVARRGFHITREYSIDPLNSIRVAEVMDSNVMTIPADMKVAELCDHIALHDPVLSRHQGLPILNRERRLVGIITRSDLLRTLEQGLDNIQTVLDAGSSELIVSYPDETLQEAASKMAKNNIGRLPVVDRRDLKHLVGYLSRSSIMMARTRQIEDEYTREGGIRI
jgi:CBS domain-containing protein